MFGMVRRMELFCSCSVTRATVFLLFLVGANGCKKADNRGSAPRETSDSIPAASLLQAEKAAPAPSVSSRSEGRRRVGSLQLKTVEGIVYLSGSAPVTSLAIETADGKVMILVGSRASALHSHQHQKVSLTGFWRPAADRSARDTLEVAEFAFLK